MKRHTIENISFIAWIITLAFTSYIVTPWVWLAILCGWEIQCGCEECQNIERRD